jgi:hypothetical protein
MQSGGLKLSQVQDGDLSVENIQRADTLNWVVHDLIKDEKYKSKTKKLRSNDSYETNDLYKKNLEIRLLSITHNFISLKNNFLIIKKLLNHLSSRVLVSIEQRAKLTNEAVTSHNILSATQQLNALTQGDEFFERLKFIELDNLIYPNELLGPWLHLKIEAASFIKSIRDQSQSINRSKTIENPTLILRLSTLYARRNILEKIKIFLSKALLYTVPRGFADSDSFSELLNRVQILVDENDRGISSANSANTHFENVFDIFYCDKPIQYELKKNEYAHRSIMNQLDAILLQILSSAELWEVRIEDNINITYFSSPIIDKFNRILRNTFVQIYGSQKFISLSELMGLVYQDKIDYRSPEILPNHVVNIESIEDIFKIFIRMNSEEIKVTQNELSNLLSSFSYERFRFNPEIESIDNLPIPLGANAYNEKFYAYILAAWNNSVSCLLNSKIWREFQSSGHVKKLIYELDRQIYALHKQIISKKNINLVPHAPVEIDILNELCKLSELTKNPVQIRNRLDKKIIEKELFKKLVDDYLTKELAIIEKKRLSEIITTFLKSGYTIDKTIMKMILSKKHDSNWLIVNTQLKTLKPKSPLAVFLTDQLSLYVNKNARLMNSEIWQIWLRIHKLLIQQELKHQRLSLTVDLIEVLKQSEESFNDDKLIKELDNLFKLRCHLKENSSQLLKELRLALSKYRSQEFGSFTSVVPADVEQEEHKNEGNDNDDQKEYNHNDNRRPADVLSNSLTRPTNVSQSPASIELQTFNLIQPPELQMKPESNAQIEKMRAEIKAEMEVKAAQDEVKAAQDKAELEIKFRVQAEILQVQIETGAKDLAEVKHKAAQDKAEQQQQMNNVMEMFLKFKADYGNNKPADEKEKNNDSNSNSRNSNSGPNFF